MAVSDHRLPDDAGDRNALASRYRRRHKRRRFFSRCRSAPRSRTLVERPWSNCVRSTAWLKRTRLEPRRVSPSQREKRMTMTIVAGVESRRPMTREERKVIIASSVGTVFEWYDFYLA